MKKLILKIAIITVILLTQLTLFVYASNPVTNFSNWAMQGVQSLFILGVACFGVYILIKRKILSAIMLLLVAGVGALFVYGGSDVFIKISDIIRQWL